MAYVYKHTRLDNNEIFYIGIGLNSEDNYKRAFDKYGRNRIWNNIVKKTPFIVDILFDNICWEDACNKEIELINFYGRKINKTGTLCNLTEGGEGFRLGHNQESKIKIREFFKDKTYDELHGKNAEKEKEKRREGVKKYWDSLTDEERKKRSEKASSKMKEFYKTNHSKRFGKPAPQQYKPILQYTIEGEFIREWDSTKSASFELGIRNSSISNNLHNKQKTAGGFIFKFKK
jgi:hypothetical protein